MNENIDRSIFATQVRKLVSTHVGVGHVRTDKLQGYSMSKDRGSKAKAFWMQFKTLPQYQKAFKLLRENGCKVEGDQDQHKIHIFYITPEEVKESLTAKDILLDQLELTVDRLIRLNSRLQIDSAAQKEIAGKLWDEFENLGVALVRKDEPVIVEKSQVITKPIARQDFIDLISSLIVII